MSPEKTSSQDNSPRASENQTPTKITVPEFLARLSPGSEIVIREKPGNPIFNEYQIPQAHKVTDLSYPSGVDLTLPPTSVRAGTYTWVGEAWVNALFLKNGERTIGNQRVAILKRNRSNDTYVFYVEAE